MPDAAPAAAPSTPAAPAPASASTPAAQPSAKSASAALPPESGAQSAAAPDDFEEFLVNGQTKRVPKSEVKTLAQKGLGASEMFREAQRLKREAEQADKAEAELFKTNPREAIRKRAERYGVDHASVAKEMVVEEYNRKAESPEAKEARELKEKLSVYEREKAEQAEAAERTKRETAAAEKRTEWSKTISAALPKIGLPIGPESKVASAIAMTRIAHIAHMELEETGQILSADEAAERYNEALTEESHAVYGALEGPALLAKMGGLKGPWVSKVVAAAVAEMKAAKAPAQQQAAAVVKAQPTHIGRDPLSGQFKPRDILSRDEDHFARFVGKK
jgi:hypothetical protein